MTKKKDNQSTLDDITSSLAATADSCMMSLSVFGTAAYMLEYTETTVRLRPLDVREFTLKHSNFE